MKKINSPFAFASFIIGLLSILDFPFQIYMGSVLVISQLAQFAEAQNLFRSFFNVITLGIAAASLILGGIALIKREENKILAITGIILGIIAIGWWIFDWLIIRQMGLLLI